MAGRSMAGAMTAAALGRLLLLPSDPKTVLKGDLGVSKRASWSKALSLDAVRGAAKRTGGTINDVMLSVLCGALSRYVTLRGGVTDGVTIRAICPVNLRGKDIGPMGNHFGLVFVDLPLDDPEPVGRMRRIKSQVDHIKNSPDAVVALGVLGAMGMASPDLEHLGVEIFTRKASTLMTNVPGPPTRMSFSGKPVTSVMVWAPVSGRVGLGVSVLSYAGEVRVGVAADAGLVPDPEQIVVCFEQEWSHYLETVSRI